jgi:HK97 gp10 family phage protein
MADEWNNWLKVAYAMTPACTEAVTKVAQAGEAHVAAQIIANGQVDTGNMLKSVYSSAPDVSTYSYDVERALPEIDPESDTEAILAVSADYAIYPNYGTVHQPANPFWEPALEEVKGDFEAEMGIVAVKLEEAGR